MCDLTPLTVDELRARLSVSITNRLHARSRQDRARAGDDVLEVLDELARRGSPALPRSDGRSDVRTVPQPRRGPHRSAELLLVAGAGAAAERVASDA